MPRNVVNVPLFTLNDGNNVPSIGLGCWLGSMEASQRADEVCKKALAVGYRHFDTVRSEEGLGAAIRDSGILREEFYIVTKLWNDDHHRVREAFEESLANLGCGYIDMYLMHWPQATIEGKTLPPGEHPTFIDTWKDMEKLMETGKVKSIGVSNFSVMTLIELLPHCKVVPAANQVEFHPYHPHLDLQESCKAHDILLTAYSPLGAPPSPEEPTRLSLLNDSTVTAVAQKHGVELAQVLLSWSVRHGVAVIPKTESEARLQTNIALVNLDETDMKTIDNLHKEPGKHRSLLTQYMTVPLKIMGWKYEWLGWKQAVDGAVLE
ncbi:Aldo/keto reductase [Dentipellis sp. KUC8613]|nr:Aldo/keto reductase [Dentipellis sp. KUC8613]